MYQLWLLRGTEVSKYAKKKIMTQPGIEPLLLYARVDDSTSSATSTNLGYMRFTVYLNLLVACSLIRPCMPVLADAYVFRAFLSKNSSSCKLVQIICLPIISSKSDFNRCRDFRVIKATKVHVNT